MTPGPRISIIHRLPGRLRLRIDATSPDWKQMEKDLRGHPGIGIFQYSSINFSGSHYGYGFYVVWKGTAVFHNIVGPR